MAERKAGSHSDSFQNVAHPRFQDTRRRDTARAQKGDGYDFDFVPTPDPKYECPICMMVLKEPMQTQCGHRYCKGCINKWLRERGGPKCPLCNDFLAEGMLFPDNFAKREIMSLTIRCPNANFGCKEIVEIRNFEDHLQSVCGYVKQPCPNACDKQLLRKDVDFHIKNECPKRLIQCPKCEAKFKRTDEDLHSQQCPASEVSCSLCGLLVQRRKYERHKTEECDLLEKNCKYATFGCKFKGDRKVLDQHKAEAVADHLEQLTDYLTASVMTTHVVHGMERIGLEHSSPSLHLSTLGDQPVPGGLAQTTDQSALQPSATTSGFYDQASEGPAYSQPMEYSATGLSSTQTVIRPYSYPFAMLPLSPVENAGSRNRRSTVPMPVVSAPPAGVVNPILEIKTALMDIMQDVKAKDRRITQLEEINNKHDVRVQDFEARHCNGTYLWPIKDYHRKRQEALSGHATVIHSPGFYSCLYGYKLCIRANLDGVETAQGSHMSLFVHFMKGDYDDLLEWPFQGQITITIMDQNESCDQRQHFCETLVSKPHLAAFQKPSSNRNHKGFGYIEFAPIDVIETSSYIKNDCLVIKAVVESRNS